MKASAKSLIKLLRRSLKSNKRFGPSGTFFLHVFDVDSQLETALAAERLARIRSKHGHSTSVESETDLSESTHGGRPRSHRSARRATKSSTKSRNRSETSSTLTEDSGPIADDESTSVASQKVPPRSAMPTIPSENDND